MLSKETWDRPTAATLIEWANNPSIIQIDYSLLNPEETMPVSSPQLQPQLTPITNTTNETTQTEGRATQRFGNVEQKESGNNTISYPSPSDENKPIETKNEKSTSNKKWGCLIPIIIGVVLAFDGVKGIMKANETRIQGFSSWYFGMVFSIVGIILGIICISNAYKVMKNATVFKKQLLICCICSLI